MKYNIANRYQHSYDEILMLCFVLEKYKRKKANEHDFFHVWFYNGKWEKKKVKYN